MHFRRAFLDCRIQALSSILTSQLASGSELTIKDLDEIIAELRSVREDLNKLDKESKLAGTKLPDEATQAMDRILEEQYQQAKKACP